MNVRLKSGQYPPLLPEYIAAVQYAPSPDDGLGAEVVAESVDGWRHGGDFLIVIADYHSN